MASYDYYNLPDNIVVWGDTTSRVTNDSILILDDAVDYVGMIKNKVINQPQFITDISLEVITNMFRWMDDNGITRDDSSIIMRSVRDIAAFQIRFQWYVTFMRHEDRILFNLSKDAIMERTAA